MRSDSGAVRTIEYNLERRGTPRKVMENPEKSGQKQWEVAKDAEDVGKPGAIKDGQPPVHVPDQHVS